MRVLLIEDDPMIGQAVQAALRDAAHAADWVHDGRQALATLACHHYDLVLLDLGLPDQDGHAVLARIRARDNPVPLLIITARDDLDDRLRGLDGGADDYLVKPFQMAELLARMRAVLRRRSGVATPVLSNGQVSLDLATKAATVAGGQATQLSNREFSLLHALMARPGAILAQRAGRTHLRLGRGGGEQCRGIPDPCAAQQARARGHQERQGHGMDGFQGRLNGSVQRKLSLTLSLVILGVAIVAGAFSFLNAFDEAHELQDDMLRQIAQLVDHRGLSPAQPAAPAGAVNADEESRVFVQRVGETPSSRLSVDESGILPIPATVADGLHTLDVRGEAFRVMVRTTATGERIAVAQEAGLRNEIARDGALRTVMPLLILVPVLLLIVADLVRKMFRPIAELSQEVDQRAGQALHPLEDTHLPVEVQPFAGPSTGC
jgi:DNA-binding response OmpR family regulator